MMRIRFTSTVHATRRLNQAGCVDNPYGVSIADNNMPYPHVKRRQIRSTAEEWKIDGTHPSLGCHSRHVHPLTAPITTPFTKHFCRNGYAHTIGPTVIIMAAIWIDCDVTGLARTAVAASAGRMFLLMIIMST